MRKILIFLLLFLVSIFLISQASAFFGCAPTPDPTKYAHIWKEGDEYHLVFCFTPRTNVQTHLSNYGLTYDGGELRGDFNVKYNPQQKEYEIYVSQTPLSSIIASLEYEATFIETPDIDQARRIANILDNFASFMVEDHQAEITYLSTNIFMDKEGILSQGRLSVPRTYRGENNLIYAGSIISTYYLRGVQRPYTQPELQISGVTLEFTNAYERKLTWNEANAYFIKADRHGKQTIDTYTADVGTVAIYSSKNKMLKPIRGKLYRNGQELRNAVVKLVTEGETQLCYEANLEYCIPAESQTYPLAALITEGSFGVGEFNIEHNKETGETKINKKVTEIIYSPNPDRILNLISV